MGTTWGYARVSTEDQELGLQVAVLCEAGVPEGDIVREKASGKAGADKPLYAALLSRLQADDRFVVWKVDRLLGKLTLDALQTAKAACISTKRRRKAGDLVRPFGAVEFESGGGGAPHPVATVTVGAYPRGCLADATTAVMAGATPPQSRIRHLALARP